MRNVYRVNYSIYSNFDGDITLEHDEKIVAVKHRGQIDVTLARYHDIYAEWLVDEKIIVLHECELLRYES